MIAKALIALVRLYQRTLGHVMGGRCRHLPTCSEYSIQALQKYGAWGGAWRTAWRLLRCHPLGTSGYDPP